MSELVFAIIFILAVVGLGLSRREENLRHASLDEWRALAEARGLMSFEGKHERLMRICGDWDGVYVWITSAHEAGVTHYLERPLHEQLHGKLSQHENNFHTIIEARVPVALPDGLKLFPQGLIAELCKLLGEEDHLIGDAEFDDRFIIQGADPEAIRAFLQPEANRRALTALYEAFPEIEFDGQNVRLRLEAIQPRAKLEQTIARIAVSLRKLVGDPPPPLRSIEGETAAPPLPAEAW